MTSRRAWNLRTLGQHYGRWAALVLLPILLNGAVWLAVVAPQRASLEAWQTTQGLTALKPRLATLTGQSRQLLSDWQRTSFTSSDPSAVIEHLRRVAGRHRVHVSKADSKALQRATVRAAGSAASQRKRARQTSNGKPESDVAGFSTMPIEVEVSGTFGKLAHWLSEVETHAGFRVDEWSLTPGTEAGEPNRLTVRLTALLREGSPHG